MTQFILNWAVGPFYRLAQRDSKTRRGSGELSIKLIVSSHVWELGFWLDDCILETGLNLSMMHHSALQKPASNSLGTIAKSTHFLMECETGKDKYF